MMLKWVLECLSPAFLKSAKQIHAFDAWERHLEEVLKLPFEAVVSEFQEKGLLQQVDKVKVHGFEGWDNLYGIIVSIRAGRRKYAVPLCDLEVIDRTSSNYQPVKDYAVWFANR
ncbi:MULTISPECIES: calcium-binding protein [Desulfonatronospira]|nr:MULTISPECIES: calcium-binding protein [Desulfonatronospira]